MLYLEYQPDFFGPDGPLSHLAGYEYRSQQQKMANMISEVLHVGHIGLIEAGTGTGKSLAYLYPAICYAIQNKTKVVISTNTINLQEQLFTKDIPILDRLGIPVRVVVVKGWSNYPCWLRCHEAQYSMSETDQAWLVALMTSLESGKTVTHGDFSTVPDQIWDEIQAESDLCQRARCEFFNECSVFKNRREAEKAEILIVNHHLLLADISVRQEKGWGETAVLPAYSHVIFDEAHHIQEVATEYFGCQLSLTRIRRLLAQFYRQRSHNNRGILLAMRERIEALAINGEQSLIALIDWELLPQVRRIEDLAVRFFSVLEEYRHNNVGDEIALRIHYRRSIEDTVVLQAYDLLHSAWLLLEQQLRKSMSMLEELEEELGDYIGPAVGLRPYYERVITIRTDLEFLMDVADPKHVYWLGLLPKKRGVVLQSAPIDVGPVLRDHLLMQLKSGIFTSATLTVNHQFDYYEQNIGLDSSERWQVAKEVFASPFGYQDQVCLGIPVDFPNPDSNDFVPTIVSRLRELLPITQGKAFVLFTSYIMLNQVVEELRKSKLDCEFPFFVQGESSRHLMIEGFRNSSHSVLFGTDSFWEGVDVVGEALSVVIITKLPFRVPTDPVIAARAEKIEFEGGNAFTEYFLPQAIIKFRQGCGRLIRSKTDRGVLLVLDRRIVHKQYGTTFIRSLPKCIVYKENWDLIKQEVNTWLLSSAH